MTGEPSEEASPPRRRRWLVISFGLFLMVMGIGIVGFWDDLQRNALDPKMPFQTYVPPKAPDYAQRTAWYLMPTDPAQTDGAAADVFFVSPTTYDGGEQWNAPLDDRRGTR